MTKAIVSRQFNASNPKKGVSIRVEASAEPQTLPVWVIEAGEAAGAATRVDADPETKPAAKAAKTGDK